MFLELNGDLQMQFVKAIVLAICVCTATDSSLAQDLLWRNLANGNTNSDHSMITVGSSPYDAEAWLPVGRTLPQP